MIARILVVDFSRPYKRGEWLEDRILERVEERPTKLSQVRHPLVAHVLEMIEKRIRITPDRLRPARNLSLTEAAIMERVIAPYAFIGTQRIDHPFAQRLWASMYGKASEKDLFRTLSDVTAAWGDPCLGHDFAERIRDELKAEWRKGFSRDPDDQIRTWTIQLVFFLVRPSDLSRYDAERRRAS